MKYIGIDPGISGAVCILPEGEAPRIWDMPTVHTGIKNRSEIDLTELARILDNEIDSGPVCAFVEQVNAMPGQGVASMFSFGRSFGGILGVLAGLFVSVTRVTPREWKSAMRVPADKDQARRRASEIAPEYAGFWPLKKHDGRAEAYLIAVYGRRLTEGE